MSCVWTARTWLRFSSAIAASSDGASTLVCRISLVRRIPNGLLAAISRASSTADVEQFLRGHDAVDDPEPEGVLGADQPAGEQQLGGVPEADDPRQQPGHANVATGEPDPDEGGVEARLRGGDANVGGERKPEAARRPPRR